MKNKILIYRIRILLHGNMNIRYKLGLILFLFTTHCFAGAPFSTDDPEPTDFKHFELYFSTSHAFKENEASGNLFNFEVNYGLIPNMQIHLLLPLNYSSLSNEPLKAGYANTEFGIKYRFLEESELLPQLAIYPALSIPTVKDNDFSDGTTKIYLPLWAQKSWNKLTTYGGGGYWINPGTGNKNYQFYGWEVQYDFTDKWMLGSEIYYQTPDQIDAKSIMIANIGGCFSFSEKGHILFSVGHSLINEPVTTAFASFLLTL